MKHRTQDLTGTLLDPITEAVEMADAVEVSGFKFAHDRVTAKEVLYWSDYLPAPVQPRKPRIALQVGRWVCGLYSINNGWQNPVGLGHNPSQAYQQWARQIVDRAIHAPMVTR